MFYSTLNNERDTSPQPSGDVTWEQFCELFKAIAKQPTKSGRAYIPAATNSRRDADIGRLEAAVFDLEGPSHAPLEDEAMLGLVERLQALDFVLHTTYSGQGHYRLILRLSEPVAANQWGEFWESVVHAYQIPADPSCKNPGRIYFFPSSPDGGGFTEVNLGHPLDVGALPKGVEGTERPSETSAPVKAPGVASEAPGPIDLNPLRQCLKGIRKKEAHELAQRILSGAPLSERGNRDNTVNRAASLVATATDGASVPAVMVLLEPSINAMETAPEGLAYWLAKARGCYERALERVQKKKAREAADAQLFLGIAGEVGGGTPDRAGRDWVQSLIPKLNAKGEVVGVSENEANISLVLTEDEAWKGKVKFNALTKQIETSGAPVDPESATLDVNVAVWLQRSEYKINPRPHHVGPVLLSVARRNTYDPIANYLNGLQWDGKARVDGFLSSFLGATDNAHTRTISNRWLISAVARALEPGCKVDTVLILEAGQGAGKSKALHALATPFFSDTKINVYDKDSRMLANMVWIVELAELTSMKKAESESLKAFFSEREGYFRPPYGKVLERFPRRAVFVGSTNQDEYLLDTTGNRRYWPVRVGDEISTENIMADRDQIWAEAVTYFRDGKPWWLDRTEALVAEKEADERLTGAEFCSVIEDWILAKDPASRLSQYRMVDVLQGAFAVMPDQFNERTVQDVGRALKKLKFNRKRKRAGNLLAWFYETPKEMLEAPKRERKAGVLV